MKKINVKAKHCYKIKENAMKMGKANTKKMSNLFKKEKRKSNEEQGMDPFRLVDNP